MSEKARENGEGSIYPYKNGFAAYAWVTTPEGEKKRKYVYGKEREQVYTKWVKLLSEAEAGPVVTAEPKVVPFLNRWLRDVIKPNCAPLTYATLETFVRLHLVPYLGEVTFKKLTVPRAQAWMNKLAAACQCCVQGKDARRPPKKQRCCAKRSCCKELLSRRTLFDIRGCLRNALTQAMREEIIARNVAKLVKVPKLEGRGRGRTKKRWSNDEAKAFLKSARDDNDPLYAAYVLVVVMAMRKGEVLGVPLDAPDFEAEELDISYQLQRVGQKLLHRETKTEASDDTLPMPRMATDALRLREERRARDKKHADIAWQDCGLFFTTKLGTPIEPRNFNRAWDARCAKAGVPRITVHDGRRSCGSLLAELDVHPRVVMRILRHAEMDVTMEIYTLVSNDVAREALTKLSEKLGE